MDHFVGQHPVRGKLRRRSVAADTYGDPPASITKGHTVADTSSFEGSDPNQDLRHRKAAVIGRHGLSGRFDPAKNVLHGQVQRAPFDHDVDASVSDQQPRSHVARRRRKAERKEKKERNRHCAAGETHRKRSEH